MFLVSRVGHPHHGGLPTQRGENRADVMQSGPTADGRQPRVRIGDRQHAASFQVEVCGVVA